MIALVVYGPATGKDNTDKLENWLRTYPISADKLQLAIQVNSIIAPEIVQAQSRLETGNYKSVLCIEYNNLFGMKMPVVRQTTAVGSTENGFAIYGTWYDSVRDMKLWQEWYATRGRDMEDYYRFLTSIGYAEDGEYINKLTLLCTL